MTGNTGTQRELSLTRQQTIEVYDSFFAIARQLKRLAHQSAVELGLTVHQMSVLNAIFKTPGLTQKEVTERMALAKSRVSLHIDVLVEKGLATRTVSVQDRRETELRITELGEDICRRYNEEAVSLRELESALSSFTPEDMRQLLTMHGRLLDRLGEQEQRGEA